MNLKDMFWKAVEIAKSAPGAFGIGLAVGFFLTKFLGL